MFGNRSQGIVLIIIAATLWGTTGTAQKFATLTLSSYWIGAIRLLIAAGFFVFWLSYRNRSSFSVSGVKTLPWLTILIAAAAITVYNIAFFAGVRSIGIAIGTAIALGSGPVWAGTLQGMFYRRVPSGGWWLALLICVAGLMVTFAGSTVSVTLDMQGMSLCLLSGLGYAVYALATKQMVMRASATKTNAAVFTMAAVVAIPAAFVLSGLPSIAYSDIAVLLWLGLGATGIAYLLFTTGLQFISSATGVALALVEPIAAVCLAFFLIGERISMQSFSGLFILFVGLAVMIKVELKTNSDIANTI